MPLRLLKGIRHFKNNQFRTKKDVFASLSKGQAPDVLFFGCIDSRIDLRQVTNANLGELLVNRNAGNIVTPYTEGQPSAEAASIEFALKHLQVNEIIVCGHSHCGAMKGLMTPGTNDALPNTWSWLKHAQKALDHVHQHHPECNEDSNLKLQCLTKSNVLLQIGHLKTHPEVAKHLAEGKLKIHGWYYEFENGEIYIYNNKKNAFVAFEETVDEIAQEQLERIVQEEARHYLNELNPRNERKYPTLSTHFNSPQPVELIWNKISAQVRKKAQEELGELYLTSSGYLSPKFAELLKKGPAVQIQNTQNKYQQLEEILNQALTHQNAHLNMEQQKVLNSVSQLKKQMLHDYSAYNHSTHFDKYLLLATSTRDLTHKLMDRTARVQDLTHFKSQGTEYTKLHSNISRVKTLLETLTLLATGIITGFFIAGIPGAAIGAGACTLTTALRFSLWAYKKDPIDAIVESATKLTSSPP